MIKFCRFIHLLQAKSKVVPFNLGLFVDFLIQTCHQVNARDAHGYPDKIRIINYPDNKLSV